MATITTIQSLLTCNGSAQPAMVALTPNELRLIAAAPDLLSALEEAEDYFDNRADADVQDDRWVPNAEMQMLSVIRAAIAKAKGEAPTC